MNFCPSCGAKCTNRANFCSNCGEALNATHSTHATSNHQQTTHCNCSGNNFNNNSLLGTMESL